VSTPRRNSAGSRASANRKNGWPTWATWPMKASATTAPETVLRYSAERPLLSAIEAERAVCRVNCSVVRAWGRAPVGRSRRMRSRPFAPLILSHQIPPVHSPHGRPSHRGHVAGGEAETPPQRPGSGTLTADRPATILPQVGHSDGSPPTGRNQGTDQDGRPRR